MKDYARNEKRILIAMKIHKKRFEEEGSLTKKNNQAISRLLVVAIARHTPAACA